MSEDTNEKTSSNIAKPTTYTELHNEYENSPSFASNNNSVPIDDILEEISSNTSEKNYESQQYDFTEHNAHPLLGMILTVLSAFCYAGLNLSVKALMFETSWQEIMMIRMIVTWIATMIWIFAQFGTSIPFFGPKDKRILLSLRAFFLWGAMFFCFWSFEFLPVGDAVTLAMSFPVWVSVISHFVFRNDPINRLDWVGWVFVLTGLAGVIFVAQPTFLFPESASSSAATINGGQRNIGVLIGLCSAMCAGAQYVIVNYTKEGCHWLQIENLTSLLSVVVFMPIGFIGFGLAKYVNTGHYDMLWTSLTWWRWLEECALGLLGFSALALLTRGSMLDAPARTAICLYIQIPVTYIGQCVITFRLPSFWVYIGIALVIASVLVPGWRKYLIQQRIKLEEEEEQKRVLDSQDSTMNLMNTNENTDENQPLLGVDDRSTRIVV